MNAFANTLFGMLLGWTRTFIYNLWMVLNSESSYQTAKWIGGNWYWLAGLLIVIGVVVDYIVWMCRWRPYYLWKLPFIGAYARRRNDALDERFQVGYQDAVVYTDEDDWSSQPESPPQSIAYEPYYEYSFQQPVLAASESQNNQLPDGQSSERSSRRRRSDRHRHRRFRVLENVRMSLTQDEDEAQYLDELPPPVDRREAFHQPVYPENFQQGSQNGNQGMYS